MPTTPRKSMSSLTGKRILSLVRDGDFAHPGEIEAVDLVLEGMPREPARRVLDLGCGLGATAALIAARGLGQVTGVDVDPDTIAYARQTYPDVSFHCASATGISTAVPGPFDAIVMFTSFYCFPDQEQALRECRAIAAADAELRVFDYTTPSWNAPALEFCTRYARTGAWKPLVLNEVDGAFACGGWRVTSHLDLTGEFRRWYCDLLVRIDDRREQIVRASDEDWYRYARQRYAELLAAIEGGIIGGALVRASLR